MSLESAIADLVSASTSLVSAVNVTKTTIEETEAAAAAQVQPAAASATEAQTQASAAATSAGTVSSKLATAAADYAAQRVTKGIAAVQTEAESAWQDHLARNDPARHAFRGNRPSLVMDFVRRECHRQNGGVLEPVDLNSFMTFTRASTATYTGPDGLLKTAGVNEPRYDYDPVTGECKGLLVEEQRTNLLTSSTNLTLWPVTNNAAYVTKEGVVGPGGALDTYTLWEVSGVSDVHQVSQNVALSENTNYTASVFAKVGGQDVVQLGITPKTGVTKTTSFNLTTATVTADASHTSSMVHVGNGWYRCSTTFNSLSGTATTLVRIRTGNGGVGIAGNSVHLYGPQLEAGAFPTSYIPTPATFTGRASTATYLDANGVLQTAASGVARSNAYDYDADGVLRPVGLLLENSATNLFIQSQNLTTWSTNDSANFDRYYGDYTTPSGVMDGTRINYKASAANVTGVYKGVSLTAGSVLTVSAYVKGVSGNKTFRIASEHSGGAFATTVNVDFNLSTGTFTTPAGVAVAVTSMANGWYRVTVTRTATATGSSVICLYSGSNGANEIVLYGAQAEIGNYATSYIPTTTAQVTRAADTSTSAQVTRRGDGAAVTGVYNSSWFSQDAFSCGIEHIRMANVPSNFYPGLIKFGDDIGLYFNPSALNAKGRGVMFVNTVPTASVGTVGRNAIRVNRTTLTLAHSSGIASTSAAKTTSTTWLSIGMLDTPINGCVRRLTYFPRLLSDADLQALTIL